MSLFIQYTYPIADFFLYLLSPLTVDACLVCIVLKFTYSLEAFVYERIGPFDVVVFGQFKQVASFNIDILIVDGHAMAVHIAWCRQVYGKGVVVCWGYVPSPIIGHQETEVLVVVVHIATKHVHHCLQEQLLLLGWQNADAAGCVFINN